MRRNGSSIDEIAATFGISKSTAHEHVRDIHVFPQEQILPDFQGRDILPPLDPMVPSYGADYPVTPTRSSDATRTKEIFVGTLQVTGSRPGVIPFTLTPSNASAMLNLKASGPTFRVQLMNQSQFVWFQPNSRGAFVRAGNIWESPPIASIRVGVRIPLGGNWYLVFEGIPPSEVEKSIVVEVNATMPDKT